MRGGGCLASQIRMHCGVWSFLGCFLGALLSHFKFFTTNLKISVVSVLFLLMYFSVLSMIASFVSFMKIYVLMM